MRWGRFAIGLLPALPIVPVVIYVAIAGGPEPPSSDETSTSTVARSDPLGSRPRSTSRPRPRLRASSRSRTPPKVLPVAPSTADPGASPSQSSQASRCCAELKRYGRSTVHRYRGFYAKLAEQCRGKAQLPDEADQEQALADVRKAIADEKAPYVPPSCRE